MPQTFNNRIRQVVMLVLILALGALLVQQLYVFFPGLMGAITLYILLRDSYFNLTIKKRWNKSLTSILFVFVIILISAVPIYFTIQMLTHKVGAVLSNPAELIRNAKLVSVEVEKYTGFTILSDRNISGIQQKLASWLPDIINSSANIVSNVAVMCFLLYFLLVSGRTLEHFLDRFIPLKEENVDMLGDETRNMIRANAIGIPILAIVQGVVATIGYWWFDAGDPVLWGFVTAIASLIPIVGTALVWLPLTVWLFAADQTGNGIGLLIYSLVVITNVDYAARITILRKLMDIHPLITVFGVIVGIGLFGFWGVIFGPLLFSYFIILVRIYMNEFAVSSQRTPEV
jgi:predicted PurR-regulated permease PerM